MKDTNRLAGKFRALRKKAEQIVKNQEIQLPDADEIDLVRLAHELEVQQVELELQNEELRRTTKELETSRNQCFELYQSAPVAFITVDANGLIEQVNKAAQRLLAGSQKSLIGRSFSRLILPEDQGIYFSFMQKYVLHKQHQYCELRLAGSPGHVIYVHLEAASQQDGLGRFSQWRFGLIDITGRRHMEDELRRARDELEERVAQRTAELAQRNQQLARLTNELTLAEQRERRRLAELLHDHLQQMLAGARLNLEYALQEKVSSDDPAFTDALALIQKSLETARTLSSELSPPVLYMHGLCEALQWLARWMKKAHKIQIEIHAAPEAEPAQEKLKVLLFQSVRELLFNVVKHSGTNAARVATRREDDRIVIEVSDTGAGFDPRGVFDDTPQMDKAYGLFSIRERLLLVGGAFDIASRPSKGTTVTLYAPLQTSAFEVPEQPAAGRPQLKAAPAEPSMDIRPDNKIRVLLADDHAVMRQGLSMMLARNDDIEIAGEAADGGQAVELARRLNPDVILMDISMPVLDGIEATRLIHEQLPQIRIIALSMHEASDEAETIKAAGAIDYLSKSGSSNAIITAIRRHVGS